MPDGELGFLAGILDGIFQGQMLRLQTQREQERERQQQAITERGLGIREASLEEQKRAGRVQEEFAREQAREQREFREQQLVLQRQQLARVETPEQRFARELTVAGARRGGFDFNEQYKANQEMFPSLNRSEEGKMILFNATRRQEQGLAENAQEAVIQEKSLAQVRLLKQSTDIGPFLPPEDQFAGQGDVEPVKWIKAEDANREVGAQVFDPKINPLLATEDIVFFLVSAGQDDAVADVLFRLTAEARQVTAPRETRIPGVIGGVRTMIPISPVARAFERAGKRLGIVPESVAKEEKKK